MKLVNVRRVLLLAAAIGSAATADEGPSPAAGTMGRAEISTVPFDAGLSVRSATYTPSGRVLVSYADNDSVDRRFVKLATMNDDGTAMRPFFAQQIPVREKDNGLRFMVFPDNRRIFLGDFVIECAPSLDRCDRSSLLPVSYPAQIAGGDHVAHRWSEMIVAPDNRHIAWTSLLSNYSALVFTGELRREGSGYVVAQPKIVSTLNPFVPDPRHRDGVIPQPLRGGEVKQFVAGGTAISLVGAIKRDTPGSVVQYLASGRLDAITDTPGYTETTIFSPDERLGMTMTTRFSKSSDPAIFGLMPRPYPAALNMGLSMFAYTYAVTGVRLERPGNVGPALIDIAASKTQDGYLGIGLNTDENWVFRSPMSWHPSSKSALWIEGLRGSSRRRIQIVRLPDYRPGPAVRARPTPNAIPYATSDLSIVPGFVNTTQNANVKVYGRVSGHIDYRRTATEIEKTYVDFSDDGKAIYSGRETMRVNPRGNSTYIANVRLAGLKTGIMDLQATFGPLGGNLPAKLQFGLDATSRPLTRGYVEFDGRWLNADALVP